MHDYLSEAKSSNFHYFVLSIGTVRGNPKSAVVAGEKLTLHHSFNIPHSGSHASMLVAILESIAACASHGASPVVAGRAFSLRVVREGVRVHTFAKSPTSVLAGGFYYMYTAGTKFSMYACVRRCN
jgi:hypothetical protein